MVKLLTRRWCGFSGGAVVMALLMGACTWWLLPRAGHQQQWTFDGTALVQWIGKDGAIVVNVIHSDFLDAQQNIHNQTLCYQLQVRDGSHQVIEGKVQLQEPEAIGVGLRLHRSPFMQGTMMENGPLEIRDSSDQVVEVVPEADRKILDERGEAEWPFIRYKLTTAGTIAMSPDSRWLLMQLPYAPAWGPTRDWLEPRWPSLAKMLPTNNKYALLIYDREGKELIRLRPSANHVLQFIMDPAGRGFLVVDRPNALGMPLYPQDSRSTLTWYALPLRGSWWKWPVILGVACLPLLRSWLRRKRAKATAPGGAAG